MRRQAIHLVFALLLSVAATSALAAGPAYKVEFQGPPAAGGLLGTCKAVSQLIALAHDAPPSFAALERRAERDRAAFAVVARSQGYYAASFSVAIDRGPTPARVLVTVDPGPPYLLAAVDVRFDGGEAPDPRIVREIERIRPEFGVGAPAESVKILAVEQRIIDILTRNGFAFARVADRRVEVDHAEHRVNVSFDLATGSRMRFGEVEILGLTTVDQAYVQRRVPWKQGDLYDASRLAELRRHLADTHLFETIHIEVAREATASGEVPVTVTLRESKHRGLGAGVFYSSADGPGIDVSWEHRNLRGLGDKLWLGGSVSTQEKSGAVRYRLPDVLATDQNLVSELSFSQQDTEAYNAQQGLVSAALELPVSHSLSLRAGPSFEVGPIDAPDIKSLSPVRDGLAKNDSEIFELFGLPLLLRYDGSDSLLDPSRGVRTAINVTPLADAGSQLGFVVNKLTGSAYLPLFGRRSAVLASRAAFGSTLGAPRADMPATKRFYAGGGGSIRGYAYQLAGPLASDSDPDARNDPLGGRSMVEMGTELRLRLGDRFGVVPFVEGGTVFADPVPTFTDRVFWGAGLGFRYFTGIGPLRVDVATPLERRSGIDDPVQFYLSLGQAF